MKVILLKWVGRWQPAGPDHGRDCIFSSEDEAREWVKQEGYDTTMLFTTIYVPPPPTSKHFR